MHTHNIHTYMRLLDRSGNYMGCKGFLVYASDVQSVENIADKASRIKNLRLTVSYLSLSSND